jgi:DNA-nicking Smr family endonuclease
MAIEIPIDGTLDLHTFQPKDVKSVVKEYVSTCQQSGILHVRIVHGKGTGTLRRTVHSVLNCLPEVVDFKLADPSAGSWGATLVNLRPAKK